MPHTVDPSSFTIDCGGVAPVLNEEFKARMLKAYELNQLVLIKNTGISDLSKLKEFIEVCLEDNMAYEGGANSRGELEPYFYETGAPKAANLHYHHEMAYVGKSCNQIAFSCKHALGGMRGATYLSDAVGVTDEIMQTELGQKLKDKGLCYWRNLTNKAAYEGEDESTVYNHWQTSFMTECPDKAKAAAEKCGLEVTWGKDHLGKEKYMMTKFHISAFEYAPNLDRNIMYSSIADHHMWFDSWPGV